MNRATLVISKRNHQLGEYRLSINMDRSLLYIHEVLWDGGGWNICEGLWIYESQYPTFRAAYISLKDQRYGIACVQDDRLEQFTGMASSRISVERKYIARRDDTWTLYEVNSVSLHTITMTTQAYATIMEAYEQYLCDLPITTEEEHGNDAFHAPT
jgi:hypothetical protein